MTGKTKAAKAPKRQVKLRDLKSKKTVQGGTTPSPGGPVPIPYPNRA